MQQNDAQRIAEMVSTVEEKLADAGFTGVKLDRAPASEHVMKELSGDASDEDDDMKDPLAFGENIGYHRVTTDQAVFGIWFQPYVMLDIGGLGLDLKAFLTSDDSDEEMPPEGWCLIRLDESTFPRLLIELIKKSRQP